MNRLLLLLMALWIGASFASESRTLRWPDIESTHKPWTRWWWHGNAVDSSEIARHLKLFADAGIGGVEITSIYGVRGQEEKSIPYLSNAYLDILNFTAENANQLGLGVDIPPGSGWRCGGLGLPEECADAVVVITVDTVRIGETWEKDFDNPPQALVAFSDDQKIDLTSVVDNNHISWSPPDGVWSIYSLTQRWSGAKVKRPAPGGEGLSFNPYSITSTKKMLEPLSAAFCKLDQKNIRCIFHDSFEYSGNWMPEFLDEFEKRRGYDVREFLPELTSNVDNEIVRRVKCDYRETISDLVLENFILPLKEWSHDRDWTLRNQSHGSPANLLDLYGAVDIPETEIFRFDHDPRVLKFASSAANVMGKPLVSAESFTWQAEHFTVTLDTMKRSADLLFASGINHIFFHGTAYSPQEAAWPGWVFYASSQINPQNPLWRDLPYFNQYITRCQALLQTSRPDNDVLVYWPVYDVWSNPDGLNQQLAVHHPQWISENPAGRVADRLNDAAVSYDFISDAQLRLAAVEQNDVVLPGASYKTIVIPECQYMPLTTLNTLITLVEQGATIIVENEWPEQVPGFAEWQRRQKMWSETIASLRFNTDGVAAVGKGRIIISSKLQESLHDAGLAGEKADVFAGLQWLRKKHQNGHVYFLSNTGSRDIDGWIPLATEFKSAALFNPMNGDVGMARTLNNSVYLQLRAGESILIKTFESELEDELYVYWQQAGAPITLNGEWTVEFIEGGPELPSGFKQHEPASWTANGDAEAERFAGTACYSIQFDAPSKYGDYQLNLGRVAESAQVKLNGQPVGTLFARPFSCDVKLKQQDNRLDVVVTNLPANRIRHLDRRGVAWRIFHDINFVNIEYKPFDASNWPVRDSGLLGPVTLTPISRMEF